MIHRYEFLLALAVVLFAMGLLGVMVRRNGCVYSTGSGSVRGGSSSCHSEITSNANVAHDEIRWSKPAVARSADV